MNEPELVKDEGILSEILGERERQRELDWCSTHDDEHECGELAMAAAYYASTSDEHAWPFGDPPPRAGDRRRDLIKSAALIVAEIRRLDREISL